MLKNNLMSDSNRISHRGGLAGRIGAAILMVILIAWGYWWMSLIAAGVFLFIYSSYYEIIVWGVCFDALYASPQQGVFDYRAHIVFLISVALFFASIFLKKRLAFYS
jgi:hypothetical protein